MSFFLLRTSLCVSFLVLENIEVCARFCFFLVSTLFGPFIAIDFVCTRFIPMFFFSFRTTSWAIRTFTHLTTHIVHLCIHVYRVETTNWCPHNVQVSLLDVFTFFFFFFFFLPFVTITNDGVMMIHTLIYRYMDNRCVPH